MIRRMALAALALPAGIVNKLFAAVGGIVRATETLPSNVAANDAVDGMDWSRQRRWVPMLPRLRTTTCLHAQNTLTSDPTFVEWRVRIHVGGRPIEVRETTCG